jgi:hypothetical protein
MKTDKVILFNDIINSVKLWSKYNNLMFKEISRITRIVNHLLKNYNSVLVKMIGDSFMIVFDDILDSIDFAIKLDYKLNNTKTYLGVGNKIHFRTGIYYGNVEEKKMVIQKCLVKDFFGNVVNIASRLQSKVSSLDTIAIGIRDDHILTNILDFLKFKNYEYKIFEYKKKCNQRTKHIYKYNKTKKINTFCKNIKNIKIINKDINVLIIKKKN